jgi:endonuclease YncB( thermonuclease family)
MRRLLLLVLLVVSGTATNARGPEIHEPWSAYGDVVRVLDGDTFDLRTHDHGVIRVRFAGIDAPERGQAFSKKSREFLELVLSQDAVKVDCYKNDDFAREVCRVFSRSTDVGIEMLKAGLAWHFKRFQGEQTEDERKNYEAAEEGARAARKGLWEFTDPMAPWECRKLMREGGKCR